MFGCKIFITQFSLLNFCHLSLITLKYYTCLAPSLSYHHLIFFTLFVDPISVTRCSFFLFFLPVPRNPKKKKTEPRWRKERKKEKKKQEDPRETKPRWEKKKKVDWSKGAAELWLVGPSCMFNYKNIIELWVTEI